MPNNRKCWRFNGDKYLSDLEQEMKSVLNEVIVDLYNKIKANLMSVSFKNNPVKLLKTTGKAGEITKDSIEITSDALRKHAVLESIIVQKATKVSNRMLKARVRFIKAKFKESHIGIYYDHGTGSKWDGKSVKTPLTSTSVASIGKAMSSRSRWIDYQGLGKGVWVDLGGNTRITFSNKAGQRNAGFFKSVGRETIATHWFSGALRELRPRIRKRFKIALKRRVNPLNKKYWKVMSTFTLGVD